MGRETQLALYDESSKKIREGEETRNVSSVSRMRCMPSCTTYATHNNQYMYTHEWMSVREVWRGELEVRRSMPVKFE